jgi:hypothetical protein
MMVGIRRATGDWFDPLRLIAAVAETAYGGTHPGPLLGAHVAVEDVLVRQHVVVGVQAALEGYRPATA